MMNNIEEEDEVIKYILPLKQTYTYSFLLIILMLCAIILYCII